MAEVNAETCDWRGQVLFWVDPWDGGAWEFVYDVTQFPWEPGEDFQFRPWNRRTFDNPDPWLRWTEDQGEDVEVPTYVYNYFLG